MDTSGNVNVGVEMKGGFIFGESLWQEDSNFVTQPQNTTCYFQENSLAQFKKQPSFLHRGVFKASDAATADS